MVFKRLIFTMVLINLFKDRVDNVNVKKIGDVYVYRMILIL